MSKQVTNTSAFAKSRSIFSACVHLCAFLLATSSALADAPEPALDSDALQACTLPSGGLYAIFSVSGQSFSALISNPTGIEQALATWQGDSDAHIPIGRLVCQPAPFNCPWNFYLAPDSVRLATHAVELCDGSPSYVEDHCKTFANGSYCPWNAQLIQLRDCRKSSACPVVPR